MEFTIKKNGAEFWNANPCGGRWSSYAEFLRWVRQTEPYIFSILDRHVWTDKKVIESGCGQGTTLNYLPPLGATTYGLDFSFQSLKDARSGAKELAFIRYPGLFQADAERLPVRDGHFDIALSIGVLHHTPNTLSGIKEIYRVLKPGGVAIVMLYRSGNPKWWMTRLLRAMSGLVDCITGKPYTLAQKLRDRQQGSQLAGTALLELFGVPILKAFTNRQCLRMFEMFSDVRISNHQPGFRRMADIFPFLHALESVLTQFDRYVKDVWGFYQVIEARK